MQNMQNFKVRIRDTGVEWNDEIRLFYVNSRKKGKTKVRVTPRHSIIIISFLAKFFSLGLVTWENAQKKFFASV